jgi:hypothetical protein
MELKSSLKTIKERLTNPVALKVTVSSYNSRKKIPLIKKEMPKAPTIRGLLPVWSINRICSFSVCKIKEPPNFTARDYLQITSHRGVERGEV